LSNSDGGDAATANQAADATNYFFFDDRDALVLSGGGARGAYQVGVLKAMAEWLPEDAPCPFEVLVGASAGALNATALAARATSFREGVRSLEEVWSNFTVEQVFRADSRSMLASGMHWFFSLLTGGWLVAARSMLDTSPLREAAGAGHSWNASRKCCKGSPACGRRGDDQLRIGPGRGFDGEASIEPGIACGARVRRTIDIDVLMASSAIRSCFQQVPSMASISAMVRCGNSRRSVPRCNLGPIACW
jgi:hypothetical protein